MSKSNKKGSSKEKTLEKEKNASGNSKAKLTPNDVFKAHFIKKLGYRAGVPRIRSNAIPLLQENAFVHLCGVVEKLAKKGEETQKKLNVTFEYSRNCLGLDTELDSLPSSSCPTFSAPSDSSKKKSEKSEKSDKSEKKPSGEVVAQKIQFYQKHSDCFILSQSSFARDVRAIASQYGRVQFAKDSLRLLQHATEKHILDTLGFASKLASHRKSKTIEPIDFQFISNYKN